MKNKDLKQAKGFINQIKDKGTNDFRIALMFIEMEIDKYLGFLEKLIAPTESVQKFEQERREMLLEHAEMDEQGNLIVYNRPDGEGGVSRTGFGIPNITRNKKGFETKLEALRKKYEQSIKEHEKKLNAYEETLEKEVKNPIKVTPILKKDLPDPLPYDVLKAFKEWGFFKI